MIGLYGPIVFVTGVIVDDMKKSVAARWGTHEIWQAKPVLEYAGPSLIEISFKISLLKPFTIDPTGSIVALQEIMDLATPLPLILGLLPLGRGSSLFIMESLEVEYLYFFQGGGIMGANCDVKLKEYPDPGLIQTLKAALGGAFGSSGGSPTTATGDVQVGQLQPDVNAGPLPADTVTQEGGTATSNLNQGPELVGQGADDIGGTNAAPSPSATPQVPQSTNNAFPDLDNIGINNPNSPQNIPGNPQYLGGPTDYNIQSQLNNATLDQGLK